MRRAGTAAQADGSCGSWAGPATAARASKPTAGGPALALPAIPRSAAGASAWHAPAGSVLAIHAAMGRARQGRMLGVALDSASHALLLKQLDLSRCEQ
mmetsp:Transcript_108599/g.339744  ORF Transcript_108599/g.339744 Transcript_108599/m.339744 type:complete len:98 (-) Transcript_108599:5-298(-)